MCGKPIQMWCRNSAGLHLTTDVFVKYFNDVLQFCQSFPCVEFDRFLKTGGDCGLEPGDKQFYSVFYESLLYIRKHCLFLLLCIHPSYLIFFHALSHLRSRASLFKQPSSQVTGSARTARCKLYSLISGSVEVERCIKLHLLEWVGKDNRCRQTISPLRIPRKTTAI